MSTLDTVAKEAQLKNTFDELHVLNDDTTNQTHKHFQALALRHVFATQPLRTLPYTDNNLGDRTRLLNDLVQGFLARHGLTLWQNIPDNRESTLNAYFEQLLLLPDEDEVLLRVLGIAKKDPHEWFQEQFEEAHKRNFAAGGRRAS